MFQQLHPHSHQDFICNNCQEKFYNETAYSPTKEAVFLEETYCVKCVKAEKTKTNDWTKIKKKSLGEIPQEPSQNLQAPELAPTDKRISGRTKQLNLKVKEQTYWKLKELALKDKCLMTEILEKALQCYEKHLKIR